MDSARIETDERGVPLERLSKNDQRCRYRDFFLFPFLVAEDMEENMGQEWSITGDQFIKKKAGPACSKHIQ